MQVTIHLPDPDVDINVDCPVRSILDFVGDKWTALVISHLATGPLRFTQIKRNIKDISQRMLTVTLRGLERNGLVTRTVFPTIPATVEYALTPLGESLLVPVQMLIGWAIQNRSEIAAARKTYDEKEVPGGKG
ncbi:MULTISPECIES: winged helix-turn-helix transcriptional regulator [Burkholderia]|uniref:winged helix-turn-helix transcriptional regulator n=1 Tax=Burkholderia TaxID=32008 RepID=UPI000946EB75|nr:MULTISPECIES: helix-turn-helix domain-containing protein [Burkholderia]CAB3753103.1 hypothetical protein LMG30113_01875 [Burkholderia paludis]